MKCLNCKNSNLRNITRVKKREVVVCDICGLARVKNIPTKRGVENTINKISKEFFHEYLKEKDSYIKYFQKKVDDLDKYSSRGLLLDVGCGPGTFLQIAKDRGWNVVGVDLSKEAVELCRGNKLKVLNGTINSKTLGKKRFDAICAFQLIEHVTDPIYLLRNIFKRLKKGGVLIITTPDRLGLVPRLSGKHWFEYYNEEHLYFFTKDSLKGVVERSGFETLNIKTEFGRSLDIPYIWDRLTNYYYTTDSRINVLLNRLKFIPKFIGRRVAIKEPWVNIYLIARKT